MFGPGPIFGKVNQPAFSVLALHTRVEQGVPSLPSRDHLTHDSIAITLPHQRFLGCSVTSQIAVPDDVDRAKS